MRELESGGRMAEVEVRGFMFQFTIYDLRLMRLQVYAADNKQPSLYMGPQEVLLM